MRKSIVGMFWCLFFVGTPVYAEECFLIKDKNKALKSEGQCESAYAPHSSFKIALSLMAFDSGILASETEPSFTFSEEKPPGINVCKGEHTARTWMRDSCVWFSQELTKKMGMKKFKQYVSSFKYGNKDVSGDPGKSNGLTKSWLSSSLRITPSEQIEFLQRMLGNKLSVSPKALEMTKKILFVQELAGGWKLYGKTGNGRYKGELQHGWFVGWIEKGSRKLTFVSHIVDESKQPTYASFRARNEALVKLWYVIDELEKGPLL